jgi:hypothetical protein
LRPGLEAQVLIVSELLFERILAVLERVGHDRLRHLPQLDLLAKHAAAKILNRHFRGFNRPLAAKISVDSGLIVEKCGQANDLGPCLARIRRLFGLDGLASEIDEVAPREWTSGLLQPATREKAAEVDGLKSISRNQPLGELFRFRVVSRRKSLDGRHEANSRPIALPLAALTRGPGNGAFAPFRERPTSHA